ncbi:MAG: hypothetical protein WAL72_31505 [Streptosporangiaceae bacterium]
MTWRADVRGRPGGRPRAGDRRDTAIAGAVLIALDLPNPANFGVEGRRILFTLIGVGIAVVFMVLVTP